MIHEVRLPEETKTCLGLIVDLQMDILECVANLDPGFTEEALQDALAGKMPERAREVTEWLHGSKNVWESLQEFARGCKSQKHYLVSRMRLDIQRLYEGDCDETLECLFTQAQSGDYCKGARKFLLNVYDRWRRNGLKASLFHDNPNELCLHIEEYGPNQFLAAFARENPLTVCAICDGHTFIEVSSGDYMAEIEHYFPRSIYPHLALHPYNLIPICRICNQQHRDKDPLEAPNEKQRELPNERQRKLSEVFLPYRPDSVSRRGALKLEWNVKDAAKDAAKSPAFKILSIDEERFRAFYKRVRALSDIYDIPNRWTNNTHQIGEKLWRRIRGYFLALPYLGDKLDKQVVQARLKELMWCLIEDQGREPWGYVLVWYLANIMVEELEQRTPVEENPLVATIQDIPSTVLSHRPLHPGGLGVDEILQAVRKWHSQSNLDVP
jgi:5-methylcytosine-specific restriction endonuclease McrA